MSPKVDGPGGVHMGLVLALGLGILAHLPAVNNGFISDDYVILERVGTWVSRPSAFSIPPEGIRLASYICFGFLKALFGYRPAGYYAFAILLHLLNVLLLWLLIRCVSKSSSLAGAGAVLFAVYQNPQEAVWWLSGMSDTLVAAFVLGSLVAWSRGRCALSVTLAAFAMLSKDSGVTLLALIPLVDHLISGKIRLKKSYAWFLVPVLFYAALFTLNARANSYLGSGLYAFGPHAIPTVLHSMHRLAFPWVYGAILILIAKRQRVSFREPLLMTAWMAIALAPYSFITFQNHVPSRSQYLAALGAVWLVAALVDGLSPRRLQVAFLSAFVLGNVGYLWTIKDRQYVARAAPTERLVEVLVRLRPQTILIENFPFNPWVAKDTSYVVPGWQPGMIFVNEAGPPGSLVLRWDELQSRYAEGGQSPHQSAGP